MGNSFSCSEFDGTLDAPSYLHVDYFAQIKLNIKGSHLAQLSPKSFPKSYIRLMNFSFV